MILAETLSALYNMSIVLVAGVIFFITGQLITDWRESSVVESQHACSEAQTPKKLKKERRRASYALHSTPSVFLQAAPP
jgi:hypothetical protein